MVLWVSPMVFPPLFLFLDRFAVQKVFHRRLRPFLQGFPPQKEFHRGFRPFLL